jgi:hypothetical protein
MSKQTSVEWFVSELKEHGIDYDIFDIAEQANEMHKQEIIEAYEDVSTKDGEFLTGEQYYNETFKS